AQLWPLGTADGMSAVIVRGGPDASAWAGPMRGTARDNPASNLAHGGTRMTDLPDSRRGGEPLGSTPLTRPCPGSWWGQVRWLGVLRRHRHVYPRGSRQRANGAGCGARGHRFLMFF